MYRLVFLFWMCVFSMGYCSTQLKAQTPSPIQLRSTILFADTIITDVWGYDDPVTGKNYAIVGLNGPDGVAIVDVTDPDQPFLASTVEGVPGFDVKVWDHYVYSVTGGGGENMGAVVDITDPLHPRYVGPFDSAHNITVDNRGYLYASGPSLRVYDLLTDPTSPTQIWQSGSSGHDASIIGTWLYDFHGSQTNIYDATDPSAPVLISTIDPPNIAYHHSGWTSKDGNYLFICDELAKGPMADITVWDISDPAHPFMVATFRDPNATVHNLYIIDDLAFVSYYTAGFRVFDVSNPTRPRMIGEFDTAASAQEGFSGAFGVYPFTQTGLVYVTNSGFSTGTGTLYIFQVEGANQIGTATEPPLPSAGSVTLESYPNPFSGTTSIAYTLNEPAPVELSVYDALGRRVRTLQHGSQASGQHRVQWNGRDEHGQLMPAGLYLVVLHANNQRYTLKSLLTH